MVAVAVFEIALAQTLREPLRSVIPTMNATGIGERSAVSVTFNPAMLPASVNSSSVFVFGDRSGRQSGAVSYDQGKRELTFTPEKKYIVGEQLQFILTDSVGTSDPYHRITGGFSYKFLTGVQNGSGQFTEHLPQVPLSGSPYAVAVGDFNGDGSSDCVVAQKTSASVSVYLNSGRNNFLPPQQYAVGTSPEAVLVTDINGDGAPDIIAANRLSNSVSILSNSGSGIFSVSTFPAGKEPVALAAADCNNDGRMDIAMVSAADSMFRVYRYGHDSIAQEQSIRLTGIPSSVLLDDLNNDGYIDGAITVRSKNILVLLKGDSTGHLSYDTLYSVGAKPEAVIAFDAVLGSDGAVDLATINSGPNTISIFKNDLTGRMQGPETFAIGGTGPAAICGNDFDGDGDVDLAISNSLSKSVTIFRNNGFGLPDTFTIPLTASPHGIAAIELTGKYSIMDLIVCNDQSGTVSILRNNFISPPAPELSVSVDAIQFSPASLNDTAKYVFKVLSYLTPIKIDSVKFATMNFSSPDIFPLSLGSYDSTVVTVYYIPKQLGNNLDIVKLFSIAGVISIPISGESPLPMLTVSTSSVQFGEIKITDTAYASITLRNSSINSLTIDSVYVKGPAFRLLPFAGPMTLHGLDSLIIQLRFIPLTVGDYADTVTIVCASPVPPKKITLSGKGTPRVGVEERSAAEIPAAFALQQNYPNPFNPVTVIPFSIPAESHVSVAVYDVLGRLVTRLVDGDRSPGNYSVYWNAANVSSGLYYYRMEARTRTSSPLFIQTRTLMLVK